MLDEVIIFLEAFPIICIQELSPHRLLVGVEYNSSLIVIDTSNGETVNAVETIEQVLALILLKSCFAILTMF